MMRVRKLLVTGLGTGYLPIAPGTWGSAAVVAVFLLVAWASGGSCLCVTGTMLAVAIFAAILCVALGRFTEQAFGAKDPGKCTIDEWAGQAVALLLLPMGTGWRHWLIAGSVSFVLFRLADIVKPPPARQLEALPHGWGVLLDDLVAGIYANAGAQLLLRLWLLAPAA